MEGVPTDGAVAVAGAGEAMPATALRMGPLLNIQPQSSQ